MRSMEMASQITPKKRALIATIAVQALLSTLLSVAPARAQGTVMPIPLAQWLNNNGTVLFPGGLCVYAAGTTTLVQTFTTSTLGVANANPVLFDSAGRPSSGGVFLTPGVSYKFALVDYSATVGTASCTPINGVTLWTVDRVAAVPQSDVSVDITGTAGGSITLGEAAYLADGTGGTTSGRWYRTDADAAATSSIPLVGFALSSVTAGDPVTIRIGGKVTTATALAAGQDYYLSGTAGALANTAGAFTRYMGRAESATVLVTDPNPRPQDPACTQVTTSTGTVNDFALSTQCPIVYLRANNATLLTLTGFVAPTSNIIIELASVGAGNVALSNQTGSVAANQIVNSMTTGIILESGTGRARLIYDLTNTRWRVLQFEQGDPIAFTPTWTGSGGNPAIGTGTLAGTYTLRGNLVTLEVRVICDGTTTFGAGTYSWALPLTAANAFRYTGMALILDSGTAYFPSGVIVDTTTTFQVSGTGGGSAASTAPMTWATGDTMRVTLTYQVP